MEYLQWHQIYGLAAKQKGKWAVYIGNGLEFLTDKDTEIWNFVMDELIKLYGDDTFHRQIGNILHGGMFFFDSKAECYEFYRIFEQPLTDSSAIYACTYNPSGECETENT